MLMGRRALGWVGVLSVMMGSTPAQDEEGPGARIELHVEQGILYDDNVFRLSDDARDRLEEDRASDRISGRYDDMDSAEDVVLATEMQLRFTREGLGGRDLRLAPGLRYEAYLQNPAKNHPEVFLDLDQKLGGGRRLGLALDYRIDVFARNYLADVTDRTGRVSGSERRYDAGVYDQWAVEGEYEHRLWRRAAGSDRRWYQLGLRRLDAAFHAGVGQRFYQSPFSNRDRDTWEAGLELAGSLGKDWTLTAGTTYEDLRTDHGLEVLIRDEPDFGQDFNGDGDALDDGRATLQPVDRSRNEWALQLELEWQPTRRWTLGARSTWAWQDYRSRETVDVTHRGRKDRIVHYRLEAEWEFRSDWSLSVVAGWVDENSNRSAALDAADEDVDYQRSYVGLVLAGRF